MNLYMHTTYMSEGKVKLRKAIKLPKEIIVGNNYSNIKIWVYANKAQIGKFQIEDWGHDVYRVTGIYTVEQFRNHKLTHVYFSWLTWYLLQLCNGRGFTVDLIVVSGSEAYNINRDSGKFVYSWYFDANNKNVYIEKESYKNHTIVYYAKRVFPLSERDNDIDLFKKEYAFWTKHFKKDFKN